MWIASLQDDNSIDKLELEIRLGVIVGEGFRSGIRKEDFESLCHIFSKQSERTSQFLNTSFSRNSDYIYQHPEGNLRILFDEDEKKCIAAQMKQRSVFTLFVLFTDFTVD